MVAFYFQQRWLAGASQAQIWGEAYFRPEWQLVFDSFHSIPMAAVGLGLACWRRLSRTAVFCASLLLHSGFDLPFHHDDAHRHFLPLSHWRYESPLSYWDPQRFAEWTSLGEVALVIASSVVLWRRFPVSGWRAMLLAIDVLYAAAYVRFYG